MNLLLEQRSYGLVLKNCGSSVYDFRYFTVGLFFFLIYIPMQAKVHKIMSNISKIWLKDPVLFLLLQQKLS